MRFYILILSILVPVGLSAQEKISFAELDKDTYDLYQKADWKQLKDLGEKGLQAGYDYYYIRMRLGVSYYELNRYEKAASHFRKALEFNDNDPAALEYLYYSLVLSGRTAEAHLLASEMPDVTREKISIPGENSFSSIFIEGGRVLIQDPDSLTAYNPSGPYVYHYLIKDYLYLAGGVSKNMGPRLNIIAAINHMRFDALQEVAITDPTKQFPRYFSWEHQNQQTGFYIGTEYLIQHGLTFGLSANIIGGEFNYMRYNDRQGMDMEIFSEMQVSYSDYVVYADINRRFRTIMTKLSASISDLADIKRFQPGLGFTWYPMGNLNLYLHSQFDGIISLGSDNDFSYVIQGLAGSKIFSKLWMEVHAASGSMSGWSEKSAYIVYNNQDPILYRLGTNLIIPDLFDRFSLTFRYQYQKREHAWEIYNGSQLEGTETKKYPSNSLIGGITWKF